MAELDARRSEILGRSASIVQRKFRSYSARQKFILLRYSAIQIQAISRGHVARICFECRRREAACLRVQKDVCMYLKRKAYRLLCSSAITIQNGMRGMAARNMYRHRKQTKAASLIQSLCRQYLACRHYLRMRKASIVLQTVCRGELAHRQLKKLRMAAKETGALQDAKAKLEKQVEELTYQLQLEKRKRADMEEAKNQEITKLQSALRDGQVQFQETNGHPVKENETPKKEIVEVPVVKEVPITGNETVDKLAAENEKLKGMVSSLEQKIKETNKLSEERLKQAMDAESMIIELKISMQRLQEKLSDMETENQILRKQAKSQPSNSVSTKDPENGHNESASPVKRLNSSLRDSADDKQQDDVDALITAVSQELGFTQGKPVATCIIYKSLMHWKSLEAEKTSVFDRLSQMIGSTIEKEQDNKHMAYWLSTTSTLLFLIQRSTSPDPNAQKPQQPQSLFGRMTQAFQSTPASSHVEAKEPALLFKQQLASYVAKIYVIIRDNLKKDLLPLLSSCLQAPSTSKDNSPPASYWESIVECLNGLLGTLKEYHVPPVLVQRIFTQVFSYINVQIFNSLVSSRECCTVSHGEYVKAGLVELELWCGQATTEYAGASWDEVKHARQTVGFLVMRHKSEIFYDELTADLCPALSVQQLYRVCTLNSDDNDSSASVSPEVISNLKGSLPKDYNDSDSNSFLLDDNSSIPLSTEEINWSLDEKEFTDVKPSGELLENPAF